MKKIKTNHKSDRLGALAISSSDQSENSLSFIFEDNLSANNAWLDELVNDASAQESQEVKDNELISDFFDQSFRAGKFTYFSE